MIRAVVAFAVLAAGCAVQPEPSRSLLAAGQSASFSLVSDGHALYWAGRDGVRRLSLADGTITAIADDDTALALTVAADRVYWASTHGIVSARTDGSDVRVLVDEQRCVFSMASDERYVYWGSPLDDTVFAWDSHTRQRHRVIDEPSVTGVATFGGRVYWSSGAGRVASALPDGADHRLVAEASWPRGLAVTAGDVFWANADGAVERVDAGGAHTRVAARGRVRGLGSVVAANDDGVYWIADDTLYHAGSEIHAIAETEGAVITADDDTVYWITREGEIYAYGPTRD